MDDTPPVETGAVAPFVFVGLGVTAFVGAGFGVLVGSGVTVGAGVSVGREVAVGCGVFVGGTGVFVGMDVAVGGTGVEVGGSVGIAVGVDAGTGVPQAVNKKTTNKIEDRQQRDRVNMVRSNECF